MPPTSTTRSTAKKPTAKRPVPAKGSVRPSTTKRRRQADAHAAFTLEEALEITKTKEKLAVNAGAKKTPTKAASDKVLPNLDDVKQEKRILGAASLADILGYNPESKAPKTFDEEKVPKKHLRYFRLLLELREHVNSELHLHTEDTLKRSPKEDSGDLSSYSQHAADSATDSFDRDFALSLVSNEQEALHEIEEAIDRIMTGTYGVCELTGTPIAKDRLLAVPFARYSVESQAQVEKTKRRTVQRGAAFADATAADGAGFIQENPDE